MIVQFLLGLAFAFIGKLVQFLPMETFMNGSELRGWFTGAITLIANTAYFLPWDVVVIALGCIIFWVTLHMSISAVKFVLDFLPFF